MVLTVAVGHATRTGPRKRNEDFLGVVTPHLPDLNSKGVLAAIADGVSGNEGGREAAEYTVRGLLSDYYATPDTWTVAQAMERVVRACNSWVQQQGAVRPELAGMATTLTGVVLRGGFYYFVHVGDSRLYLLRDGELHCLTTDHVWDRPEMRHVLTRAVGLDSQITIDHGMGELRSGDVLLLATDGVWAYLKPPALRALLAQTTGAVSEQPEADASAGATAEAIVDAALAASGRDNASALVLRVLALPELNLRDSVASIGHLPVPPRLQASQVFEGLRVEELLHASPTTLVYRVSEPASGRDLVLKTLSPERGDDPEERSAFAHEEWLARRAVARFFAQVVNPPQRNYLYYLSTYHAGHSLQEQVDAGHHCTVPEALNLATQLVRAVGALHRRAILHRDIKPANVHCGEDGQLRLLDFGVAQSGLTRESASASQAGTPSFLAPELFEGAPASPSTDLYALGVTLYYVLTRRYPYGEVEAFQRPHFGAPASPVRYRPDIPPWFESLLLKAVARLPAERFETAEEFLIALERGATRPLPAPAPTPLVARLPRLALWRALALAALAGNLVLGWLLVRG
ncbi:bifunctional protein-serine/threonine kinase/phosphatase [Massilia sp. TS11]|uniref:bifunctional protein-serine/threonine kinase/phosphatase n=1 Tax=Massilia sp. TS11 TaxID=2908003 RepID=UPI001EDB4297|nr:bifunctional protein-serine/threonine kinase/phosphatase [Massilia sp. TS11]MCG2583553.1 protein phosphatase 2C domain-containing protein [Massilia sp. TS11]